MSGTRAELVTQALIAHSPAVFVTRVEESWYPAETDGIPFVICTLCVWEKCNTERDTVSCISLLTEVF